MKNLSFAAQGDPVDGGLLLHPAVGANPLAVKTVLYVEDEEMDRFFMERAFQKEELGTVLQTVPDGRLAIAYLSGAGEYADRRKYPLPSVLLLDLNLPEVHGFEVLEWIRAHPVYRALPVVVFSSSERQEDQARAKQLGANEFVKKPGSGVLFQDIVRDLKKLWLDPGRGARSP